MMDMAAWSYVCAELRQRGYIPIGDRTFHGPAGRIYLHERWSAREAVDALDKLIDETIARQEPCGFATRDGPCTQKVGHEHACDVALEQTDGTRIVSEMRQSRQDSLGQLGPTHEECQEMGEATWLEWQEERTTIRTRGDQDPQVRQEDRPTGQDPKGAGDSLSQRSNRAAKSEQ